MIGYHMRYQARIRVAGLPLPVRPEPFGRLCEQQHNSNNLAMSAASVNSACWHDRKGNAFSYAPTWRLNKQQSCNGLPEVQPGVF
jgi:hypothetical protein